MLYGVSVSVTPSVVDASKKRTVRERSKTATDKPRKGSPGIRSIFARFRVSLGDCGIRQAPVPIPPAASKRRLEDVEYSRRRYRKMLKNEYLLAKIGVDTAENGPPKV